VLGLELELTRLARADLANDDREHGAAARAAEGFGGHRPIVPRNGPRRRESPRDTRRRELAGHFGKEHLARRARSKNPSIRESLGRLAEALEVLALRCGQQRVIASSNAARAVGIPGSISP
jgi:hypothetical protein